MSVSKQNGNGGFQYMNYQIMIVFFLVFIGISLAVGFRSLYYVLKGDKVDAIISYIRTKRRGTKHASHDVYVEYVYNNQVYENVKLGYYQTGFYEGKSITIYLFPDKPTKAQHAGSIIFIGIGVLLIASFIFCIMCKPS